MLSEVVVRLIESSKLEQLLRERRLQALERYRVFLDVFSKAAKLQMRLAPGGAVANRECDAWGYEYAATAGRDGKLICGPLPRQWQPCIEHTKRCCCTL
ncbi:hypothetical protein [Bradyrhizobium sp. 191]|uniref:hypothetical protein n=1 Tax=Bradyrhizobium sp. 191 TaxID=2782659 RepID=UPI0020000F67|nr:hypothetical protein [Bradyrhizobium sp. 191]